SGPRDPGQHRVARWARGRLALRSQRGTGAVPRQSDPALFSGCTRHARARLEQSGQGLSGLRFCRAASGRGPARVLSVNRKEHFMAAIARLGYLGFEVSNLDAWERFGVEILGLAVSERRADGGLALRMEGQGGRRP